ncbi:uncharacterized protein LOC143782049 [Ranitomeya variabilis]|uniref:uncharacterized protein LOC143782049 n=1 Tax=Ranitomeya variabilis TaxID=490064 RepID=UPI004055AC04
MTQETAAKEENRVQSDLEDQEGHSTQEPPDPPTSHNMAHSAQQRRSAMCTRSTDQRSKRVSQRDQGDTGIDVDLLISSIQERGPLWDSRDPRHMDQVVSRRLWAEVAKSLWDGFDSASAKAKGNFMKKLRTRWRSMKDRFNKGIRAAEEQARSGAAASKSVPYKYNRALQFLRPVLTRRQTHSSTLQRAPPCEAELHGSPSDPSQPSHSDSRLAPPSSGEPAAGTSGFPLPEASGAPSFGNSRQCQRASDRSVMPEFLHLGTVFQNGFKALSDKMSSMERRLEILEAELSNPAKHFLSTIAKGMVENLTPELQISVMQDCNNSYVRALQQSRRMQSATLPVVPSLASMTPTTAAEPLQPTHPGPSAERRHHRHHSRFRIGNIRTPKSILRHGEKNARKTQVSFNSSNYESSDNFSASDSSDILLTDHTGCQKTHKAQRPQAQKDTLA